jgi:hypothetical protein
MEWIPWEGMKRGCPRKTWMEGVQAAITAITRRNLEPDQWREEWRLVSGRRRQLLKKNPDGWMDGMGWDGWIFLYPSLRALRCIKTSVKGTQSLYRPGKALWVPGG